MAEFVQVVLDELAELLRPLQLVVESEDPPLTLQRFLRGAGWQTSRLDAVDDVIALVEELRGAINLLRADPIPDSLAEADAMLTQVTALSDRLRSLGASLGELAATEPIEPISATDSALLAEDLAHYLIINRLAREPILYGVLEMLGFIDQVEVEAASLGGWLTRSAGTRARLRPELLPEFLAAPVDQLRARLVHDGWRSQADAVATNLLVATVLGQALAAIGGRYRLHPNLFRDPRGLQTVGRRSLVEFLLPESSGARVRFGAALELLSAEDRTPGGAPGPAVTITPYGSFSAQLTPGAWIIDLLASAALADEGRGAFTIGAHGVEAEPGIEARLELEVRRTLELMVGGGGTGIRLGELALGGFASLAADQPDFGFSLAATGSSVGLSTADMGATIDALAGFDATLAVDVGLQWSLRGGLSLTGAAGLELPLARNLSLGGVINLANAVLRLDIADTVELSATTDLSLALGPLYLGFDGLGLALTLEFGSEHGNLGGANLGTALRLPTGVALALDTPVASGGGLVIVDYEAGEYAGVLDVELFDVGVTAIALLATKLPSGSGAWSLLASLSATFTGLQLGFGFTLNGVGGLIGANRGLDEDALASGIRSGALDGLLFPEDPVRDAARILADMNTVFPVAEGQWVLGPIVKIGWGTPSIIELDLGVIVQLPDPLTISLLGTLSCVLPDDDAAILQLNVDFAGTLNLSEGTLKVDASLRESKVAGFALTGDMAVRAAFIDQPSFLISFGGFHPEFSPPASFPKLARLAIALDTGDDLRVQLGGYFALTSNTLQFGAKAEFWAKAKGLTATGGTSFDALIQFKPFRFSIALKVWVDVRAKDVELLAILLAGKLEGPKPWYIQGVASFKILGVKTRFEVEATIGRAADQKPRELVRVEDLLIEDLRREGAWSVVPPAHDGEGVITCDAGTGPLRVHPAGRIEVRQRVVPLGRRIDHYGEAKLGGADTFTLTGARIGSSSVASEDIDEWFAAAQYWSLKPAEKLSSPSFEQLPGGVRLGDDELDAGEASPFTIDREVVYRDPLARAESRERPGTVVKATALALQRALGLGSSRAARSQAGLPRSTAKPATLSVGSVRYVAVDELSGTAASKRASTSFYAVRDAAAGETATRVVPAYELELSK